eukprot:m.43399 g.43399  ORF g.43399 m.43399 type:complete len:276 (-) comp7107_c0_seq3:508-1335(-)
MSSIVEKKKGLFHDLVAGVISGTVEVCILQPTLYMKTASQSNLPLSWDPRVLYRGVETSILNMALMTGIQFPLVSVVEKFVVADHSAPTTTEKVTSSFIGGWISGIVCGPLELTMINQMANKGHSLISMSSQLVKQHGFSIMGRGVITASGREAIYTAGYIGLGPALVKKFQTEGYSRGQSAVAGAVIAGVVSSVISHPIDTIKTKMQRDVTGEVYKTIRQTAATIFKEGGLSAFYLGAPWRVGRTVCAVFIIGQCKDFLHLRHSGLKLFQCCSY